MKLVNKKQQMKTYLLRIYLVVSLEDRIVDN
jgi:hypothetical protein